MRAVHGYVTHTLKSLLTTCTQQSTPWAYFMGKKKKKRKVWYFSLCLLDSALLLHVHSENICLFNYQILLYAPESLLSQCSRLTKNRSPGFTQATVSHSFFFLPPTQ